MKTVTCSHCGIKLQDNHSGPCPNCGEEGLNIHVVVTESVKFIESVSGEKRSQYYQRNKKALTLVIIITILSPFVGLYVIGPIGVLIGLVLGLIAYFVGPIAITKVIEKEKF